MNAIPTASNSGLLVYLAVALVLVAMAAVSRPRRGVALDTPGPHKNNPGNVSILAESDVTGANPTPNKEQDMNNHTTPDRLYYLDVTYPEGAWKTNRWGERVLNSAYVPEGFTPTEQVPAFYWPSDHRIYRHRGAAQERAALLRRYGCKVQVLECTPVWESIPAANMRRRKERLTETIEKRFAGRGLTVRIVDHRGDEEGQR